MCLIWSRSGASGNARIPAQIVSHPIMLNRVVLPEVCGPPGSPAGSWASAAVVVWQKTALVYQPGPSYETLPE